MEVFVFLYKPSRDNKGPWLSPKNLQATIYEIKLTPPPRKHISSYSQLDKHFPNEVLNFFINNYTIRCCFIVN